ncbi:MAG: type II toxin-antitoxin system Phd/YefM family antitoxin [Candidatus Aminicenantes bacterium]|nr:type II toxin-antitoxin system Phd/YefM family antitoxin [Candidatus Aminicenantes bacterium]
MSVSNDIVPIGKFKTSISKWFKSVHDTGHPLIITQNGKPAGVLLSPSEYDELVYKRAFLDSINRGIADAESGKIYNSEELKGELRKIRKQG